MLFIGETVSLVLSIARIVQVLIKEEELVEEEFIGKPPPLVLPGDKAFRRHISKSCFCSFFVWEGLLTHCIWSLSLSMLSDVGELPRPCQGRSQPQTMKEVFSLLISRSVPF